MAVLESRTRRVETRDSPSWVGRAGPAVLLVLAGLVVWQVAVDLSGVRPQVLPSPLRVVEQGWAFREELWTNTLPTLQETAVGFGVSLAVGWTIAVAVDFVPWLRRAVTPLLVASQTLPIVAIAPLLIIWFGFGLLPKVVVIALVTFFPIAIGLIEGFAATDRQATALLLSMGASRLDQFRYVRVPGRDAVVLHRVADRHHIRRHRRDLRRVRGRHGRVGDLHAGAEELVPHRPRAGRGGRHGGGVGHAVRADLPRAAGRGAVEPGGQAMRLTVEAVVKSYPGLAVLDDVAFDVRSGEFVSVIGPSGCGKSTLFDVIAGLERPDAGRVLVDGADATGRVEHAAYMPQRDLLFPWRSVLDNTALGLEVAGVRRREARARARALFGPFGLAGFEDARPEALSGGMRQRAALLRTVVQERSLLLLDEPFGALDSLTRSDMQAWLAGVWARYGWTVLLVTHDIREAVFLSDRVIVLTPRPATVRTEVSVDLPRPRATGLALTAAEEKVHAALTG